MTTDSSLELTTIPHIPDQQTNVNNDDNKVLIGLQSMDKGYLKDRNASTKAQSEIPPMHSAAVNGDKNLLSKLLTSGDLNDGDKFGRTPLMYCVLADRHTCAEMLLKANADVNRVDSGGRTALHWASHKGNYNCLKLLIGKNANPLLKDSEGHTAMHLATRHKSAKCLLLIIKQLTDGEIDEQDNNKRTALHWAASYGNIEHVSALISRDSNIGVPDIEGKTPLHWSATGHDSQAGECLRLILETTPSVINWRDFEGRTALHLAVAEGKMDVVQVLTSFEKCEVSAVDNMFRTPLHWAAVLGHTQIVKILLDKKASCLRSDSNGATPLHYAAQNNFSETVEAFIARSDVKDEPDIEGRTAFMWAASKAADASLSMFLKYGTNVHQLGKNGATALHAVALVGSLSSVKLLLSHGADINSRDDRLHTPLFRASEMGHTDVVQLLINQDAMVRTVDQDGRTPLHWAALGGHAYICQTLIKNNIDPNIKDHTGRTPLQCSAYVGYVNAMSVLIEHKADTNSQDNEGMSALHWACSKGHLDSVKLLVEFHAFPNLLEYTEDRYTPLDYALMSERYEVAQYMIEQGGLSITGIQDIAALKIQSVFRGYRTRKTFIERKRLLMKHEQLRRNAAKKKDEKRRGYTKLDSNPLPIVSVNIEEEEELHAKSSQHSSDRDFFLTAVPISANASNSVTPEPPIGQSFLDSQNLSPEEGIRLPYKKKKKALQITAEEAILLKRKQKQEVVLEERRRLNEHRVKDLSARVIQSAWRNYREAQKGKCMWEATRDALTERRAKISENEWQKQIAALTIQLAWRKYFRRKLLKCLTPKNRKTLHLWDPSVIAAKQRSLINTIYREQPNVKNWHPTLTAATRPSWFKFLPSPAALSYNFAVDQYRPFKTNRSTWSHYDFSNGEFENVKLNSSSKSLHFSYNLQS